MKIVWAFDPFAKNKDLSLLGKNLISKLFGKSDSIELVYVASNMEAELAISYNVSEKARYFDYPKKLIKEQLKKLALKKIDITVLFEKSLSLSKIVKKIVEYTQKNQIDLIVVATNSKKLLPKFIFGSFAETLIHISSCDLLIYHQKTKFNLLRPTNILYAHDFSEKGAIGLLKAAEYAKKWNCVLTVVHVPIPPAGVELSAFKENMQKRVLKIERSMGQEKVKCRILLEYEIAPISEILLRIAGETKANLIALTAQSNKLSAFLGGSITRQVLRETKLPTLVLKV